MRNLYMYVFLIFFILLIILISVKLKTIYSTVHEYEVAPFFIIRKKLEMYTIKATIFILKADKIMKSMIPNRKTFVNASVRYRKIEFSFFSYFFNFSETNKRFVKFYDLF